jgi:hypothetical protein
MKVKIVRTPPGEAPLWVREAWVGLEMESVGRAEAGELLMIGACGGRAVNGDGFRITAQEAMRALGEKREDAKAWWTQRSVMAPDSELVFATHVCAVVDQAAAG